MANAHAVPDRTVHMPYTAPLTSWIFIALLFLNTLYNCGMLVWLMSAPTNYLINQIALALANYIFAALLALLFLYYGKWCNSKRISLTII
jgi:hypothetical protein